jgi:hypothetical protein
VKRLIAIALVVALVITAIAVTIPVFADPGGNRVVFESDFFDNPDEADTFTGGDVCVRASGDIKVEIKGAPAGKGYFVVLVFGQCPDLVPVWLGDMTEYNNGRYKLETSLSCGPAIPPIPPIINAPCFLILDSDQTVQFVGGFYLPLP